MKLQLAIVLEQKRPWVRRKTRRKLAPREIVWTTAPESYDGFGSYTINKAAGRDKNDMPVRSVSVLRQYLGWQTSRYASGLYVAAGQWEWNQLKAYRLAVEYSEPLDKRSATV